MKKSILMAIVALALLAAPAFAGDYSIVGNIDWGFGASLGSPVQTSGNGMVTNDFTMLGFFGSIDDNTSISIVTEYGASGGAAQINGGQNLQVMDFNLSSNILGAMGVTGVPVTLNLTAGFGRLNLHNRFQQWTGWEIKRWKNAGTAHFAGTYSAMDPGAWDRPNYVKLTVGIMDMVNIAFGLVPQLNATYNSDPDDATVKSSDIPMMIDIWTSGIVVGPAALDIAANARFDANQDGTSPRNEMAMGAQVTANMNFGALGLTAFVGEDYMTSTNTDYLEGSSNGLFIAVKPSYNFGAGSVALGVWFGITSLTDDYCGGAGSAYTTASNGEEDSLNVMDMAIDLSLSYATFTLYGGVIMMDLTDVNEVEDSPMKYDIGVKNSFGAASISLGITGVAGLDQDVLNAGGTIYGNLNDFDLGAADGTGNNWVDQDPEADDVTVLPTLYFRVSAWY